MEKAIELDSTSDIPAKISYYNNLSNVDYHLHHYKEIIQVQERVNKLEEAEVDEDTADYYDNRYHPRKASQGWKEAVKLDPNNFENYENLAHDYYKLHNYKGATWALNRAIKLNLNPKDDQDFYESLLNKIKHSRI